MAKWWKWKIHWKLNLWPWSLQLPLWQRCDRWLPDRMPLVGRKCLIIYTHFCSFVLRDLRQKWVMIISVKTKMWKQKQHTWSKPVIMHNFLFLYHNDIKPKPKRKNRRAYLKQTCDDSQLFFWVLYDYAFPHVLLDSNTRYRSLAFTSAAHNQRFCRSTDCTCLWTSRMRSHSGVERMPRALRSSIRFAFRLLMAFCCSSIRAICHRMYSIL